MKTPNEHSSIKLAAQHSNYNFTRGSKLAVILLQSLETASHKSKFI